MIKKNPVVKAFDEAVEYIEQGKEEAAEAILKGISSVIVHNALIETAKKFEKKGLRHLVPKHLRSKKKRSKRKVK